jgi:hypothetical protein
MQLCLRHKQEKLRFMPIWTPSRNISPAGVVDPELYVPGPLRCHILGDTGPDPTLKQGHVKNDKERAVPNMAVTDADPEQEFL